jgi:DNA-binding MarR family transcriptional regulator
VEVRASCCSSCPTKPEAFTGFPALPAHQILCLQYRADTPYDDNMPRSRTRSKSARSRAPIPRIACTCGSLRKASRRISQFYDAALAPLGLKSTQYSILAEIERGRADGPVTMCELAAALVMDRSTLGHNLRPLQRDKLLALRLGRNDRRERYVEMTKQGAATLQRARRTWQLAQRRFEKIFGKEHAAQLRTELWRIANNAELASVAAD